MLPLLVFGVLSAVAVALEWPLIIIILCGAAALAAPICVSAAKQVAKQSDNQNLVRRASMRTIGETKPRAPVAKDIPLEDWGVHPSLENLPYLERAIESRVREALISEAPVLIIGKSMAGKTRMAANLLQDLFADRQVVIPDPPDGLATLMATGGLSHKAIIWLDDLERYLTDPKNLKTRWIDDLRNAENLVVATIRASLYEEFQPSSTLPKTQWETLNKFTRIHMMHDALENADLASRTSNSNLRKGILDYGLGVYIGGGYIALDRVKLGLSNTPLGVAMLRAAIDWQRSGIGDAIPHHLMLTALPSYVEDLPRTPTEKETEAAIAWATDTSPLGGSVGLLTEQEDGWRPFDFLVDQITATGVPIPDVIWRLVAGHEAAPGLLNNAGLTAYFHGQKDAMEILLQRAAEAGDPEGLANWAHHLDLHDRHDEALHLYEKSAELGSAHGMTGLGIALIREGKIETAEVQLRRAAELGFADGMANLGILLTRQKKMDEGVEWSRKASEAGSAYGMTNYGLELAKAGRHKEAEELYIRAANRNSAGGLFELSEVFASREDHENSEVLCRRAVDGGNPSAMLKLARILMERGNKDEAETLHRRAANRGSGFKAALGSFLAQEGRIDEAELILREAADLGEPYAHHCLGVIAYGQGKLDRAMEHYRVAIQDGWMQSMVNLALLLLYSGSDDTEVEKLAEAAAKLGSGQGLAILAILRKENGEEGQSKILLGEVTNKDDAVAGIALYKEILGNIEKAKPNS